MALVDSNPEDDVDVLSRVSDSDPSQRASGLPLYFKDGVPQEPLRGRARTFQFGVKRAVDVVVSLTCIAFLGPLLAIVAIVIRMDGHPALFRQERLGRYGQPFRILKFRSMRIDDCDASGLSQVGTNDSRVTPFGRFIRKTSIDELPQLFNVLQGSMSLVGPRPHVEGMVAAGMPYDVLVSYYDFRHHAKPGMTGWAQCNGFRGPTDDVERSASRIRHDVAYIQNFSIALDFKCLLRTVVDEFFTGV